MDELSENTELNELNDKKKWDATKGILSQVRHSAAVRAEQDRRFLERCKHLLLEVMVTLPEDHAINQDPDAKNVVRRSSLLGESIDRANVVPANQASRVRDQINRMDTADSGWERYQRRQADNGERRTGTAKKIRSMFTAF